MTRGYIFGVLNPPAEWFRPPVEGIPTDQRFTITPEGRVYGYVALWDTCHAGLPGCVRPPRDTVTEAAHQAQVQTADGSLIKTAVIAGGTVHASQDASMPVEHYMNTGKQLMRVRYGEDSQGLWFAGSLVEGAREEDIAHIRGSSLSGDWRWHAAWRKGVTGYEFAGSCLVNIPGFPIGDSQISRQGGKAFSLVASAAGDLTLTESFESLTAGALPFHASRKADPGTPWDGPAVKAAADNGREQLRLISGWVDPSGDPDSKSSYKLAHHLPDGTVVLRGVQAAMARLMQSATQIPDEDRKPVYRHLAKHYKQFGLEAPEFHVTASGSKTMCDGPCTCSTEVEEPVVEAAGGKGGCGCGGGKDVTASADADEFTEDEMLDALLAAMTAWQKKKRKKKPSDGYVTADASSEEDPDDVVADTLADTFARLAARVDELESLVLTKEISTPVE